MKIRNAWSGNTATLQAFFIVSLICHLRHVRFRHEYRHLVQIPKLHFLAIAHLTLVCLFAIPCVALRTITNITPFLPT
ncbi:hypothetical protein [Aetokthonos hydrillicola]|uniref:hypothetical protein n=1 Tax=Aetokthonos hydrillicola TaxID=1550245 RepID=UPI002877CA68|nr:hypothetical protein [Aetokthonos hydrillicola]